MGLLDDQMDIDAEAFADSDSFGESVVYTPASGSPVTINAVIVRVPQESAAEGQGTTVHIEAFVRNDATYGVTTVNRGGDKISVSWKKGGTAADFKVVEILDQDAAMWRLRLR